MTLQKAKKGISYNFREEKSFITPEEGVPVFITAMRFDKDEAAELAKALYNNIVAEGASEIEISDFAKLFKYVCRLANINEDWQ